MSACALCGSPAPPLYRPPAAETAPDLDFRPGEPAHSTLARWVAQCRTCGACAPELAALPPVSAPLTATPRYRATRSRFLRWASLVAGTAAEPHALLQAAWEADDRGEDATDLRRRAASAWGPPGDGEGALQLVDILRRRRVPSRRRRTGCARCCKPPTTERDASPRFSKPAWRRGTQAAI